MSHFPWVACFHLPSLGVEIVSVNGDAGAGAVGAASFVIEGEEESCRIYFPVVIVVAAVGVAVDWRRGDGEGGEEEAKAIPDLAHDPVFVFVIGYGAVAVDAAVVVAVCVLEGCREEEGSTPAASAVEHRTGADSAAGVGITPAAV